MAGERLSPAVFTTTHTSSGVEITTVTRNVQSRFDNKRSDAKSTSGHESLHAVVAAIRGTGIKRVSVIPGPGYLGITELDSFDPVAAAAPHAHGADGTGHDMAIIGYVGHDAGSASSAAQAIVADGHTQTQVAAVAEALETHGTIYGADVHRIMREVEEDVEAVAAGKQIVDIFVRSPEGETQAVRGVKTDRDKVKDLVAGVEVKLTKPSENRLALAA